jgi:glycosyltransferase involved in cell wall biosynthesis
MLSILIATKDRADRIISCVQSILQNTYDDFEIIIVDQSNNTKTRDAIAKLKERTIKYFKNTPNGKSAALNFGIQQTKGDIIAFTDDDCIVSANWIDEIAFSFNKHPDVACVTGNTYPYKNIPLWACPPTIAAEGKIFSKPERHSHIGFGNNYAIRKSVLESIGLYREWLGPESVGSGCEDGEIMIRMLTRGHVIVHNPKMIVHHNKKLNRPALKKQILLYICGETACYGYYSLFGHTFAHNVIRENIVHSWHDLRRMAGDVIKRKVIHLNDWQYSCTKCLVRIKGYAIGLFYYMKEVI